MKREITILLLALSLLIVAQVALAEVSAPTSITKTSYGRRNLSALPAQQVDVRAGNVTKLSIDVLTITKSWAGFFGNISGVITLDDANNNTFYNWTMTSVDGEVFATRNSNTDFTTVSCASQTDLEAEDVALNNPTTAADNVNNTFTGTSPAFDVGLQNLNACPATNAFSSSGAQTSSYHQAIIKDGSGNIIYTALMNASDNTAGYDGNTWDFELLVGEDGHANSATTPYYFYVEIN